MKKTLTILWIIIIAGTIFIAIHLMKLQNIEESTSETDEATANTTDIETDSTAKEDNGNKTTEVIQDIFNFLELPEYKIKLLIDSTMWSL